MRVVIIGCGKVGSEISKNIINKKYLAKLLLFDRNPENSNKLYKSLNSSNVATISSLEEVKEIEYIILTLSAISQEERKKSFLKRNSTYKVRHDEMQANLSAFNELVPALNKISRNAKIIVVSNPVEEIVSFLHTKLKNEKVYGFGLSLDAARYNKILSKEVICIGEHGRAVPLLNLSSEKEYTWLYEEVDSEVMKFLRKKGMTYKITGAEFEKFFDNLNSKKESMAYITKYLDREVLGIKNCVASLPYIVKNGKILGVFKINPSKIELKLFRAQCKK